MAVILIIYGLMMFFSFQANNKIANSDLTVQAVKLYFDETKE